MPCKVPPRELSSFGLPDTGAALPEEGTCAVVGPSVKLFGAEFTAFGIGVSLRKGRTYDRCPFGHSFRASVCISNHLSSRRVGKCRGSIDYVDPRRGSGSSPSNLPCVRRTRPDRCVLNCLLALMMSLWGIVFVILVHSSLIFGSSLVSSRRQYFRTSHSESPALHWHIHGSFESCFFQA